MMPMDFGDALFHLRDGKRAARTGWNGKRMWVALQVPDFHSRMTQPYLYIRTADGDLVPWVVSHTDLLSSDWFVVE